MPLIFTFWFMVAAYVIHVLDESLLGGSFVEKVRQHWWPEYSWTRFFWFNTGYFTVMIASVVAYDLLGGSWVILPLAWSVERLCNGFWHVWWTIHFREYSPGLLTSILMWMDSYFLHRALPPAGRDHCRKLLAGGADRFARRRVFVFLLSADKRQKDASWIVGYSQRCHSELGRSPVRNLLV